MNPSIGRKECPTNGGSVDDASAPEHPFPAAVHDGVKACRWLPNQGHTPESIAVGGDSARGGDATYRKGQGAGDARRGNAAQSLERSRMRHGQRQDAKAIPIR
ncbi:MAG: alpha/beta hydrolase [Parvibaculum sp.]|nr:alpha/beta hydrolase [Parvibaculum sp.]